jgi:hypothetical protein
MKPVANQFCVKKTPHYFVMANVINYIAQIQLGSAFVVFCSKKYFLLRTVSITLLPRNIFF